MEREEIKQTIAEFKRLWDNPETRLNSAYLFLKIIKTLGLNENLGFEIHHQIVPFLREKGEKKLAIEIFKTLLSKGCNERVWNKEFTRKKLQNGLDYFQNFEQREALATIKRKEREDRYRKKKLEFENLVLTYPVSFDPNGIEIMRLIDLARELRQEDIIDGLNLIIKKYPSSSIAYNHLYNRLAFDDNKKRLLFLTRMLNAIPFEGNSYKTALGRDHYVAQELDRMKYCGLSEEEKQMGGQLINKFCNGNPNTIEDLNELVEWATSKEEVIELLIKMKLIAPNDYRTINLDQAMNPHQEKSRRDKTIILEECSRCGDYTNDIREGMCGKCRGEYYSDLQDVEDEAYSTLYDLSHPFGYDGDIDLDDPDW